MSGDVLQSFLADRGRLVAVGAVAVPHDEGLRRHGQAIRALSRQVPALTPLADAIEKLQTAPPADAAPALLQLAALARQVRRASPRVGIDGPLEEFAPSGPWRSDAAPDIVYQARDVLCAPEDKLWTEYPKLVDDLVYSTAAADLRLIDLLVRHLTIAPLELARTIAARLPEPVAAPLEQQFRARLDLRGGADDAAALAVLSWLRSPHIEALSWRALKEGSVAVRIQAVVCLCENRPETMFGNVSEGLRNQFFHRQPVVAQRAIRLFHRTPYLNAIPLRNAFEKAYPTVPTEEAETQAVYVAALIAELPVLPKEMSAWAGELVAAVRDRHLPPLVRVAATWPLARVVAMDGNVRNDLASRANDPNPLIRWAAAAAYEATIG